MRKKSMRFISAALAACMMASTLPVGAFALEGDTAPESGVSTQAEETTEDNVTTIPKDKTTTITEGGDYEIEGGTYTGKIVINVTDITKPVNITIKGNVTVKCDPFFNVIKAGTVNINNDGYDVDCSKIHFMNIQCATAQVTVTGGKYKGAGGTHLMMNFSGSLTLTNVTAQTESSYAITNAGTVIINGGTYTRSGPVSSSSENGAIGNGGGTMELHNVTVNSCQVAVTNSNGELTIDGGSYTSDNGYNCISNSSAGLTIYGGDFDGKDASCINNNKGTVELNGGTFTSNAASTIRKRCA